MDAAPDTSFTAWKKRLGCALTPREEKLARSAYATGEVNGIHVLRALEELLPAAERCPNCGRPLKTPPVERLQQLAAELGS